VDNAGLLNGFSAWARAFTDAELIIDAPKRSTATGGFTAEKLLLKPDISKDSIFLDMLFKDYSDRESATRLILDAEFTPNMMGDFLELDGPGKIWERVMLLSSACGSNPKCRTKAMEKVMRYAAANDTGEGGRMLLDTVLKTYNKLFGGDMKKEDLKFK
jgi:hypothetical protein